MPSGSSMKLTVIVPAFNEEAYLTPTLNSIETAAAYLRTRSNVDIDMIVVDNNSEDETAAIAREKGATVVHEPAQGIARARNTGARHAVVPWPHHRDGPRRHAILSKERLRESRRLRREGVDRRGRRLLLEPQEVRQGRAPHGAVHTKPARTPFLPSLRQVAGVEDPHLDQPSLYRVVPPPEGGLAGWYSDAVR